MTPYNLTEIQRRIGGEYCFRIQCRRGSQAGIRNTFPLNVSDLLADTRCHIPGDWVLHSLRCRNPKSCGFIPNKFVHRFAMTKEI